MFLKRFTVLTHHMVQSQVQFIKCQGLLSCMDSFSSWIWISILNRDVITYKMIGIVQSIIKLVITWFKENKIIISGFCTRPLQKFHTDDVSLPRSEKWIWSVMAKRKFSSVNQKHYLELGSDTSSIFLQPFLQLNLAGKSVVVASEEAVFSGYALCHKGGRWRKRKRRHSVFRGKWGGGGGRLFTWKMIQNFAAATQ